MTTVERLEAASEAMVKHARVILGAQDDTGEFGALLAACTSDERYGIEQAFRTGAMCALAALIEADLVDLAELLATYPPPPA